MIASIGWEAGASPWALAWHRPGLTLAYFIVHGKAIDQRAMQPEETQERLPA